MYLIIIFTMIIFYLFISTIVYSCSSKEYATIDTMKHNVINITNLNFETQFVAHRYKRSLFGLFISEKQFDISYIDPKYNPPKNNREFLDLMILLAEKIDKAIMLFIVDVDKTYEKVKGVLPQNTKFPSFIYYPATIYPGVIYNGPRDFLPMNGNFDVDSIYSAIARSTKSDDLKILDSNNIKEFSKFTTGLPKLFVFSLKDTPAFVINAISINYSNSIDVGFLSKKNISDKLPFKFQVKVFPSIFLLLQNGQYFQFTSDQFTYSKLCSFIDPHIETFSLGGGVDMKKGTEKRISSW